MRHTHFKLKERENGNRRVISKFSDEVLTDQSEKQSCCVNHMMKQYAKTGLLPSVNRKEPVYGDLSEVPNFMQAHEIMQHAKTLFYELPSEIRNKMNHDPAQLEMFIKDPANREICAKYKLIILKDDPAAKDAPKKEIKEKEVKKTDKKEE